MKPKNFKYTQEVLDFIQTEGIGHTNREIAQMLNERFPGFGATLLGVKNAVLTYKIDLKRPKYGHHGSPWPADVRAFMEANYKGTRTADLARMVNERFGEGTITRTQVRSYMRNHGLLSGCDTRFKPGVPSTRRGIKTRKFREASKATQFKPGNKPKNYMPVGSLVVGSGGYLRRKVADPNTWVFEHRRVWEEAYGPIPEGHRIVFLDGDKTNVSLDNMDLLSPRGHLFLNRYGYRFDDPGLTQAAVTTAKIDELVNSKREGQK